MNLEAENLHQTAVEIARKFHKAESALIDVLQQIDDKKIFLRLGHTSLFGYAVKALKLSEANASNFITVARKSKTVPELKRAIDTGEITVSKARKITPVITKENQSHWIELAKTLPKPKLEKEVAKVMPEILVQERARFVAESRIELKVGLSEEVMKDLRRAQDLVSQKSQKATSLEETLESLVHFFLERQDPVEKAKRNAQSKTSSTLLENLVPAPVDAAASVPGTRYIPAKIRHQVHLRDLGQCTFKDEQSKRCENQRWVDIHHQIPLFQGGGNEIGNLRTLCKAHHKQMHLPASNS